jgi:hypothetical protein
LFNAIHLSRTNTLIRPYISVLFVLLLAACGTTAPATTATPEATAQGVRLSSDFPGVIYGIERTEDGYILNDNRICLAMLGDAFWEHGDFWDSPEDLPRFDVRLNDQPVSQLQLAMSPPIIQVGDGRGGTIGSTPSGYTYCFTTGDLGSGEYLVDVVATSSSGYISQYSWDLIVP